MLQFSSRCRLCCGMKPELLSLQSIPQDRVVLFFCSHSTNVAFTLHPHLLQNRQRGPGCGCLNMKSGEHLSEGDSSEPSLMARKITSGRNHTDSPLPSSSWLPSHHGGLRCHSTLLFCCCCFVTYLFCILTVLVGEKKLFH